MAQTTKTTARGGARATIDHDEIRRWVEERGGKPAIVKRTANGRQPGILRIDFPGFSGEQSLEELGWDEWFERFDSANLAFLHQDETGSGRPSRFNKLVARDSVEMSEGKPSRRRSTAANGRRSRAGTRTRAKKTASARGRGSSGTRAGAKRSSSGPQRRSDANQRSASATKRGSKRGARAATGSSPRAQRGGARGTGAKSRGSSATQSGGKRGPKRRSQSRQK